jgi:hypothetical protein
MCIDNLLNVDIYNLVHTTHLWNSIHQICSNSKPDKKKVFRRKKTKGAKLYRQNQIWPSMLERGEP